jgi:hypothetical protein
VTGNGEDWERGFSSWICFFLPKKPGLLVTFRLMGLAHWDFLGGGFWNFGWSKVIGLARFLWVGLKV